MVISKHLLGTYSDEHVSAGGGRHIQVPSLVVIHSLYTDVHSQSLENTISEKKFWVGIIKSIKKRPFPAESIIH
jgi:hypothetical protein